MSRYTGFINQNVNLRWDHIYQDISSSGQAISFTICKVISAFIDVTSGIN